MINDLSLLYAFKWVSQEKSFSGAAKKLRLGLPQVSKKIQKLEEELGTRLFHRTTRKVSLTQDGMAIYPKLIQLLDEFAEFETHFEAKTKLGGTLRVSCITSVAHKVLAGAIVRFQKKYPEIKIELDINDGVIDLIDTQTDIAIRVEGPRLADFVFKRLVPNRLIFVASKTYLKENGIPQSLNELKKHPFLKLDVYRDCRILGKNRKVGEIKSKTTIDCLSGMMLTTLCLEGAGVALRSVWDVDTHLKKGELLQVLHHVKIEDFGVLNAVVPTRRLISARVRAFLDFLEIDAKTWPT